MHTMPVYTMQKKQRDTLESFARKIEEIDEQIDILYLLHVTGFTSVHISHLGKKS